MPRLAALLLVALPLAALPLAAAPVPKVAPDPLPDGALVRLGSARFRGFNTDGVTFSNDGKTLYATDDKNTVFRWDAESGKPLKPITFEVKGTVCSRVRGDRAFIVEHPTPNTGAHDSLVHVFDLPSGKSRGKFDPKEYVGFTESARRSRVDVSADGRRFAVLSHSTESLKVFDLSGDEPTEILSTKFRHLDKVLISPDGKRVLHADNELGTTVIDLKTGETLYTNAAEISNAAFSPDGSKLIGTPLIVESDGNRTTRKSGRLTVWDAATGKEVATPDITGGVWQPVFHSADTLFVGRSTTDGPAITRWDMKAGKEVWTVPVPFFPATYPHSGDVVFAVSPDGKRVVVSDRICRMALFDAANGKRLDDDPHSHPDEVRWVDFSTDGKTAYSATDHDYREWDAKTGELKAVHAPPEVAGTDAQFIGATVDLVVWRVSTPPKNQPWEVVAWDRAKGKVAWKVVPETKYVWQVRTVSEFVVVGLAERYGTVEKLRVYDRDGKKAGQWDVDPSTYDGTPRGFGADKVYEYEWGNGKVKEGHTGLVGRSLKTGEPEVRCQFARGENYEGTSVIVPSADGKHLILGSRPNGKGWMVLETSTGKVVAEGETTGWIVATRSPADGGKMAMRLYPAWTVRVVELKTNGKSWTLDSGGAKPGVAVAFSPDGTKAIVGYRDGTALVWDVK